MPKNETAAPVADEAGATDFSLTLEEFCARLSGTDRRVELIGAFFKTEQLTGRTKDTEAVFAGRFRAFCNQPA